MELRMILHTLWKAQLKYSNKGAENNRTSGVKQRKWTIQEGRLEKHYIGGLYYSLNFMENFPFLGYHSDKSNYLENCVYETKKDKSCF